MVAFALRIGISLLCTHVLGVYLVLCIMMHHICNTCDSCVVCSIGGKSGYSLWTAVGTGRSKDSGAHYRPVCTYSLLNCPYTLCVCCLCLWCYICRFWWLCLGVWFFFAAEASVADLQTRICDRQTSKERWPPSRATLMSRRSCNGDIRWYFGLFGAVWGTIWCMWVEHLGWERVI